MEWTEGLEAYPYHGAEGPCNGQGRNAGRLAPAVPRQGATGPPSPIRPATSPAAARWPPRRPIRPVASICAVPSPVPGEPRAIYCAASFLPPPPGTRTCRRDCHELPAHQNSRDRRQDSSRRRPPRRHRPAHPRLRGRGRDRTRHHPRLPSHLGRGGRACLRRPAQGPLGGALHGREVGRSLRGRLFPAGDPRRAPRPRGLHQGPAHDPGRRWFPVPQRRPAAGPRPLCLRAAGAVLRGRAVSASPARGRRRGHLPGEHRGRLRGYRVRGGDRREREARAVPARGHGGRLLRGGRARGQADQPLRHQPAGAQGDPVRRRPRSEERHLRPQGEHHEVHRGGVPQLGLRARPDRIRGAHDHRGRGVGEARRPGARGQDRRQGPHRGHHVPDDAAPAGGVRRHRDLQPERGLSLRCGSGGGRGGRDRSGREHGRPRGGVRGDPRNRPQVREPGQGQSGVAPLQRSHDVRLHRLAGSGAHDHRRIRKDRRPQGGDLRLRPPDRGATEVSTSGFASAIIDSM